MIFFESEQAAQYFVFASAGAAMPLDQTGLLQWIRLALALSQSLEELVAGGLVWTALIFPTFLSLEELVAGGLVWTALLFSIVLLGSFTSLRTDVDL